IFADLSPVLLRQVEATIRLIRSKGVGVYFASQSAGDLPAVVLDQLATRVEHSRELGIGRARFSTLSDSGQPAAPFVLSPSLPAAPAGPLSVDEVREWRESIRIDSPPAPAAAPSLLQRIGAMFS